MVVLTFDDGLAGQLTAAAMLRRHGLPATFFVSSAKLGLPGRLTRAQVRALAADGHEIGGHTLSHARLDTLTPARQRTEICADRRALAGLAPAPVTLAYPYGRADAATARLARECGYVAARGSGGLTPAAPRAATGLFDVPTMPAVVETTTAAALRSYVTAAERHGGVVTLVFHDVCSSCGEYSVAPDVLDDFLGWLAARRPYGTRVRTFAEAVRAGR
ncbi:hypothetical protein Misp01_50740 [Microtetraspora sp. NBRC 13810]|nr:hypothetical protein Misp01_50740 [Microtetraspora sp. NBRC 13810]